MRFIDEVQVHIIAGGGGNGIISFRREKFIEFGGPNGGNGGRGGHVYVEAMPEMNTLYDYSYQRVQRAQSGTAGGGRDRYGSNGNDLILPVPVGTLIFEVETNECLADCCIPGQRILLAQGGLGGLGNACFRSSTNQAPRQCTPGVVGEERYVRFELRVLSEVGLLGLPNAGKSTFLSSVTAANPKIADYPFTTLYPNLGVVECGWGKRFVMADIPGVVAGASRGIGLGLQFLKHLSRTKILLHIIDASSCCIPHIIDNYHTVMNELNSYSDYFSDKPCWVLLNKMDAIETELQVEVIAEVTRDLPESTKVFGMCAYDKAGCMEICSELLTVIEEARNAEVNELRLPDGTATRLSS